MVETKTVQSHELREKGKILKLPADKRFNLLLTIKEDEIHKEIYDNKGNKTGKKATIYQNRTEVIEDLRLERELRVKDGSYWSEEKREVTLTSKKYSQLEQERDELEQKIIEEYGISNFKEVENPINLSDIDMTMVGHANPKLAEEIYKQVEKIYKEIDLEQNKINREFLEELGIDMGDEKILQLSLSVNSSDIEKEDLV
jgi:hypothetical protein